MPDKRVYITTLRVEHRVKIESVTPPGLKKFNCKNK